MKSRLKAVFGNLLASGVGFTAAATAAYVFYKDQRRHARIIDTFSHGKILPPLEQNQHEVPYFKRPVLEETLQNILKSEFSNEYYLVMGEVGSGKTRSVLEVVRGLIQFNGSRGEGAPVYITASQGNNFPDSLAKAVNFAFDEHIRFKAILDIVMKTHSVPSRDENTKLQRVLDAIEQASFKYANQTGRPAVLVIDGINWLTDRMPDALPRLQEKAKLWADTNIVKLILISNDEQTEMILQHNRSAWSRAGTLVVVEDLSDKKAIEFITNGQINNHMGIAKNLTKPLSHEMAENVVETVGGRMHHLIIFRRDLASGLSFDEISQNLKQKEREKFLEIARFPGATKVLSELKAAGREGILMTSLALASSADDISKLLSHNIIKLERHQEGMTVKFESRLTENVVKDLMTGRG